MITLYIPTTTLNFNNILSSESISPSAFYSERKFGYPRWNPIKENNVDNAIILYDKPYSFQISSEGIETHPMIIGIIISEKEVKKIDSGVYYCDHTIYLNPWHTCFIFLSDRDRRITLSMSDSSAETKLIRLYHKLLYVYDNLKTGYKIPEKLPIPLNSNERERDFQINRVKGMLHGYYIGSYLSMDSAEASRIAGVKELLNILSSINASDNHMATKHQNDRLNQLIGLANLIYSKDISDGEMLYRVNAFLPRLESSAGISHSLLDPSINEILVSAFQVVAASKITDTKQAELFKCWMNFLFTFSSSKYDGKISSINSDLSDELTTLARDLYGAEWDDSETRSFLNKLRHHIRGEAFEVIWNNGVLCSLAAVLTHGDDWHKLLSFMQSRGMHDYSLAFSFYGVLNGYANLTRDFTDILYNQDSQYVASLYKCFYQQIFGSSLDINIKSSFDRKGIEAEPVNPHITNEAITTDTPSLKGTNNSQILDELFKDIPDAKKYTAELSELFSSAKGLNKIFSEKVSHSLKGKPGITKIKGWIKDRIKQSNLNNTIPFDIIVAGEQNHFVFDPKAWDKIKDLVPLGSQKQIKNDFDWFIDTLKRPQGNRDYYKDVDSNNDKQVIDCFVNMKSKPGKDGKPKAPYFTPELRQIIKKALMSFYVTK